MADDRQLLEERLADALDEFVDQMNAGAAPDPEQFLLKYRDLAWRLRPLIEIALGVGRAAAEIRPVHDDETAYGDVQEKATKKK